jgi:hypothetical protein
MNLHEQLGALEMGVDQLIQAVVAPQAQNIPETSAAVEAATELATDAGAEPPQATAAAATETAEEKLTLSVGRPAQNEITMTIGGKTVSLHPMQVGQLIEELSNARASMTPEPPMGVSQGWRFVSTRNPVVAVQKQSNGDRVLIMRHTGHGWVPFTFSPDNVIKMYALLTQR